jgi:AraC-like DNA-binding protein
VEVVRKTLFESGGLQIGSVDTRPLSDTCGDVERQSLNVVVLPLSGLFSKHDAPGRHVIGTPSHAVFIASDTPYRLGFPGGIGDRALVLRFDESVAPDRIDGRGNRDALASSGLLPPGAIMLRNLLLLRIEETARDEFEVETLGLDLLATSLRAMRTADPPRRRAALALRRRAVERVKEAVALAPAHKWSVARLARIANLSPFHLCRIFRQMVGTSLYNYVLHERLAHCLGSVLDSGDDLTPIALDAGFSSHSHFTARFRGFFGCTPAALRRAVSAERVADLRKIMTARRSGLVLT